MDAAKYVLMQSFGAAAMGTSGALSWCVGASIGYGVCLAGNFFGTFVGGLIWFSYQWSYDCKHASAGYADPSLIASVATIPRRHVFASPLEA